MGILVTVVLLWAAIGGKHPAHEHTHTRSKALMVALSGECEMTEQIPRVCF